MLKKIIATMMVMVIATTPVMANEYQSPTGQRVVTIGKAEVKVEPDIATVNIGIMTEDVDSVKAMNKNVDISKNVLQVLKEMGIESKDIQTGYYYSNEKYDYSKEGVSKVVGYYVNNSYKVTVRDIDKVGEVLTATTKAGANSNNGVSYNIEDVEKYYQEALTSAVKQAVTKGEIIGKAVGYSNLKVSQVVENTSYSYSVDNIMNTSEKSIANDGDIPVEIGLIVVSANVTVTME